MADKIPEVTVEEALRLFLTIACPDGLPAEVEEELAAAVKERVAEDRPAWAAASSAPSVDSAQPATAPGPAPHSHSQVKAQAVHHAQTEEVPSDPEERYFYERKKEVTARIEEQRREEREMAERERLARERLTHARSLPVSAKRALRVPTPRHTSVSTTPRPSGVARPGRRERLGVARLRVSIGIAGESQSALCVSTTKDMAASSLEATRVAIDMDGERHPVKQRRLKIE